ncbi:hypothetical protein [Herpetosiphon giganteus]|uniref:hypothetical protein n=1 Tax=Herpetosiphon giganteus TaxID=2029754 RepID=UPI00195E56B5|nr:hypothetical protein [Herpetosiphon giganteus]MBM7845927.1 magnesium chelatase subunit D [Herpetosiphon giganteus]
MIEDDILHLLASASLSSYLRNILILDGSAQILESIVSILSEMICLTSYTPRQGVILPYSTEDELWGFPEIPGFPFNSEGILYSDKLNPRIIKIPDLARINLMAKRTCIVCINQSHIAIERYGQKDLWEPNMWWIAQAMEQDITLVSPHILDRFSVRIRPRTLEPKRIHVLWQQSGLRHQLKRAIAIHPTFDKSLLEYLCTYPMSGLGMRRDITLTMLSYTLARLQGEPHVRLLHVQTAARLLGRNVKEKPKIVGTSYRNQISQEPTQETSFIVPQDRTFPQNVPDLTSNFLADSANSEVMTTLSEDISFTEEMMYLEDNFSFTNNQQAALKYSIRPSPLSGLSFGHPIGYRPLRDTTDIAIIPTLFTAFRHRREEQQNGQAMVINREHIQSYIRQPNPDYLLILALDYTCFSYCQWEDAINPYLQQAYHHRARIHIIQIGIHNPIPEESIRAQSVELKNVLVPQLGRILTTPSGRATPLAHGLDVAYTTIVRELSDNRRYTQHITLVVLTDGRGNIPLQNSREGVIPTEAVQRQGIDDAFVKAEMLRQIKGVTMIVLDPQPKYLRTLPRLLARTLGADLITVLPRIERGQ